MGRPNRYERDVVKNARGTNLSEYPIAQPIEIRNLLA